MGLPQTLAGWEAPPSAFLIIVISHFALCISEFQEGVLIRINPDDAAISIIKHWNKNDSYYSLLHTPLINWVSYLICNN